MAGIGICLNVLRQSQGQDYLVLKPFAKGLNKREKKLLTK